MTQEIVLRKVSSIGTAAHESMHVATFIYYIIKNYQEKRYELLDEIFEWTLSSATIVESEDSAGCFYHRNWGRFTEKANIYCSFAGFVGGYIFTGRSNIADWNKDLFLINWVVTEDMDPDKLEHFYDTWGASNDLKHTGVEKYEERLKYIREIINLLRNSKTFQEMFTECMELLMSKHTLEKSDLVELAKKYRDRIVLETFLQRRVCVSLTDEGPKYHYYL